MNSALGNFLLNRNNTNHMIMLGYKSKQPFGMISSYFRFFKNVILIYNEKKLSSEAALHYLTSINYSQMTRNELIKCFELIELLNLNKK